MSLSDPIPDDIFDLPPLEDLPSDCLLSRDDVRVYGCDWRTLLDRVDACDALITDTPYSEKTHSGHGTAVRWGKGKSVPPTYDASDRKDVAFSHWTPDDVRAFVEAWSPRVRGWLVTITDDVLAPVWQSALRGAGRFVFAPLPFIAPGSRVRLAGDGGRFQAVTCSRRDRAGSSRSSVVNHFGS